MQQRLPNLTADITRSRVIHKVLAQGLQNTDHLLALEQREIVSQAPVSMVAPYHTALIVLAAASTFVICVLTLLVLLYRRKVSFFIFWSKEPIGDYCCFVNEGVNIIIIKH